MPCRSYNKSVFSDDNQMERCFAAKKCDWLERVTMLEAEREGLRAEVVETRGRLRRAESSSPCAAVFER